MKKLLLITIVALFVSLSVTAQSIRINEVVSSNSQHVDEDGDTPDWLELHNFGTEAISIENWALTDDEADLRQWVFPNITLAPNQYLLIWASKKNRSAVDGELHTNFKISSSSETLILSNAQGTIIDQLTAENLRSDTSIGVSINTSNLVFYSETTPGSQNSNTEYQGSIDSDIVFSHQGGLINGAITLNLSGATAGQEIRYTIDNELPSENSILYTGPIPINESTTVRAQIFAENYIPSVVFTKTYILNANHDIDVILLTAEPADFFDEETGIYVFGTDNPGRYPYRQANFWKDWERPIHFAFYEKGKNTAVEFNAGVKIFGGWSRAHAQKSLALYARSKYGDSEFKHSFFDELSYNTFQSLVLRNSGNDWAQSSMRDIMCTSLMRGSGLDFQEYRPVATYLNGEYWGKYNLREKVNEHMLASKHNVDADDITLLEANAQVVEGSNTEYNQLIDYISTTDLSVDSNFERVEQEIDLKEYALYQVAQIYINNTDWPGNNIKFWKHPEGKWRWIMYDTDFGFRGDWDNNTLEYALSEVETGKNAPWSTLLFRKLTTNIGFRNMFINRYADELNTRFTPTKVVAHIENIYNSLKSEITRSFERWENDTSQPLRYVNVMKTFANKRPAVVKEHIKSQFNLPAYHPLTISNPEISKGLVEVNSNLKIQENSWVGDYFETVPVQLKAIPLDGFEFSHWSGDINSTDETIHITLSGGLVVTPNFAPINSNHPIVINEINYKSNDSFDANDWIELYNPNDAPINVSNWQLKDDNDENSFTFPEETSIAAKGYLVIVKNTSDFSAVFPNITNFIGDIDFGFGASDAVRLFNANGSLQDQVSYQSQAPWPECANSTGKTLELTDPNLDNSLPDSWNCINTHGSPNAENSQANQLPIANAGDDQEITLPTNSITLNGSGNDPDGGEVSFQWSKVSGNTASLSNTNTQNLTVADLTEGSYVFQLMVTDNEGENATDTVTVIVKPEETNPQLSSEKEITDFRFNAVSPPAIGSINQNQITVELPGNIDRSNLIATFTYSANANVTVDGTTQQSGISVNDFTNDITYTVTAEDGSTQNYTVVINTTNDLDDDDNDGVINTEDQCPNTPPNTEVDAQGCEIFSLPADNFTVMVTAESCINSKNGVIQIQANANHNYSIRVTGNGTSVLETFTNEGIVIDNLEGGTYSVCIRVQDKANYETCFDVEVGQPEALSVSSRTNYNTRTITLNLSGADTYIIKLNDKTYTTSDAVITLPLESNSTKITVNTDKNCQEIYEKTIYVGKQFSIYPNPISTGDITVQIRRVAQEEITIQLNNFSGKILKHKVVAPNQKTIKLNVDDLPMGIYLLYVIQNKEIQTQKFIKL